MTATMIASALFLAAQTTAVPAVASDGVGQREVAYEQLSAGNSDGAVATLETRLRENPDDPATLINLGTAYARQGETDRAAKAFRAAMTSDTRYRLELADGSWVDSRQAARRALASLETRYPLAALTE
jgi:cytochrome c-type biogenesis protein CcmH/NrfG